MASRFSLVVDGAEVASFNELEGVVAEVEPVEHRDGASPDVLRLVGKPAPPTVTLKRALTSGLELWAWIEAAQAGQMAQARKNCTLVMFNVAGEPEAKFVLTNAWPTKVEVGAVQTDGGAGAALIETLTLIAEAIQRVAP
jgi:phage tail-like protein